jgi:SAM-dependent MidA family methyltransferase
MEFALYHPQAGYYAGEPTRVGRSGDFTTSVTCGMMFGKLLAHHIAAWHATEKIAGPWRILEPGPNNGQLARDIIHTLRQAHPDLSEKLHYVTLDPLPIPLAWQRHHLADLAPTLECRASPEGLTPLPTFVIANEILDALPCRRIQRTEDDWQEIHIAAQGEDFIEILHPIDPKNIPAPLFESDYPIGYRTEFRDNWHSLLSPLLPTISQGRLLWIDYGFAAPEYYHPARTDGTLRTFHQHRAGEDPLASPGEKDITAHVDFTSFVQVALAQGCDLLRFEPQEFFLTRIAAALPSEPPMSPSEIRQLKTLIHPAQMGARFHALELSYPTASVPQNPFTLQRLALTEPKCIKHPGPCF